MRYRRDYTEGASYFFTVVTFRRQPWFSQAEAVKRLRSSFRAEMARRPFTIDAIAIMPDHIHAVWTLPPGDSNYSLRWRNIKRTFTAIIPPGQRPRPSASRQHKHEQAVWQRRLLRQAQHRFGSIESATKRIFRITSIISITTPSSTVTLPARWHGRTAVYTSTSVTEFTARLGWERPDARQYRT